MTPIDSLMFGADQQCFGCGPNNPHGMRLRFHRDGDAVVTTLNAQPGWEGPPGIVHGGLQATLADEVGAWTVVTLTGCFGFTTSMQLRFMRPARHDTPIDARGELIEHEDGRARVRVTLTQEGKRLLTGTASYTLPTLAQAERMLGSQLPPEWTHLTRPEQ